MKQTNPLYDNFRQMEYKLLPQFLELNFFKEKKEGTFVEFGANDGVSGSCTKRFEDRGWSGVCIEPLPQVFGQLKKNRKSTCIQGCISTANKKARFLKINAPGPECLSGIIDEYDPKHVQRIQYEVQNDGGTAEIIEIECRTFNDLMAEQNLFQIDLLSIDTEGGELGILQSIDYEKFDIDVIVAENNYKDPALPAYLMSIGYNFILRCGPDEIFKKLSFP
jgi:FkbM family methyltransferase